MAVVLAPPLFSAIGWVDLVRGPLLILIPAQLRTIRGTCGKMLSYQYGQQGTTWRLGRQ